MQFPVQMLFLLGGHNGTAWLDCMHVFVPSQKIITDLSQMPFSRGYGGAAVVDRSLYIVGGGDGSSWLKAAFRYNIDNQEWFQVNRALCTISVYHVSVASAQSPCTTLSFPALTRVPIPALTHR